jgi:hypothetical protein
MTKSGKRATLIVRNDHKLKALAIKKNQIHVVGAPSLKFDGTPTFLEVEGMPARHFYFITLYLGIHLAEGEMITPTLPAKRFTVNPVLVVVSLIFRFWMWAAAGDHSCVDATNRICDRVESLATLIISWKASKARARASQGDRRLGRARLLR